MTDPFAENARFHGSSDRRAPDTRQQLFERIETEFREMAGLSLTIPQACRLFDLEPDRCMRILGELTVRGVLKINARGFIVRADTEGD